MINTKGKREYFIYKHKVKGYYFNDSRYKTIMSSFYTLNRYIIRKRWWIIYEVK